MNTAITGFGANNKRGFTLIELVMIIVVLGILAAVAIPKFSNMSESSRIAATREEMQSIRRAIVGNPQVVAGGELIDRGFEGDVGFAPSRLADLVIQPDTIPAYDRLTRLGWNGPYIDSTGGMYLNDAWDAPYTYDAGGRRLTSVGGADSLSVSF